MNNLNVYQTNDNNVITLSQNESFNMSKKYKQKNSNDIVKFFESQNFNLEEISYSNVKDESKNGFQKHIMIFNNPDLKIDDENLLRFLVTNSHDGSSSLKIDIGLFRTVCANGLVVGDSFSSYRIPHIGNDFYDQVAIALNSATKSAPQLLDDLKRFKSINLGVSDIIEFSAKCANIRLKEVENLVAFNEVSLLQSRRTGDNSNDLYTTFNRIQESIIKGHLKYYTQKENEAIKCKKVRKLNSMTSRIDLNKELWNEMSNFAA